MYNGTHCFHSNPGDEKANQQFTDQLLAENYRRK